MKVITERDHILELANWAANFDYLSTMKKDQLSHWELQKLEQIRKFRELDLNTCSSAEVNAVLGCNESFRRRPECNECGKSVDCVVQVGEEPDYESRTAYICEACLLKACALIRQELWK
jgi:hypothetical protein